MKQLWFIFILILTLSSCAIEKITELVSDGREIKTPEWKVDYELPILKKSIVMSDFVDVGAFLKDLQHRDEDSIKEKNSGLIYMEIEPVKISTEDLNIDSNVTELLDNKEPLTWPLPLQIFESPQVMETSFPSIRMDMDKDGIDDLILDRLQSNDGYLKIKAEIFITDSEGNKHNATKEEYFVDDLPVFKISEIIVCDKKFSFDEAVYDEDEKCLVFTPKGFLSDWNTPLTPAKVNPEDPFCIDYAFKFKLPEKSLSVRGKGFDFINNLIEENTHQNSKARSTARSKYSRRSNSGFDLAKIKEMLNENGGGVEGLEALIKDEGVSVKDIADAYQNESSDGINELLEDIGDVSIVDVLASDTITENIEDFTDLIKDYDMGNGKTLGDITASENLAGLSEFFNFHKNHAIKELEVTFSVEINLGDSFIIVGRFINDFTAISMKEGEIELPLSNINKILKEIKIDADINNTFSFPVELRNPHLKDKDTGSITPILFNGKEGDFQLAPYAEKKYKLEFSKPLAELGDSDLLLDVIIPSGSECAVSLNTDFGLDMNIIAAGYASVETNSLGE